MVPDGEPAIPCLVLMYLPILDAIGMSRAIRWSRHLWKAMVSTTKVVYTNTMHGRQNHLFHNYKRSES